MANTLHQFEFVQVDQKNEINPTRIENLAKSLGSDETKWAQCWLELTWLAIDGIMPAEKVVSCMRGLATAAASIKPASKIPEALWFVGMEVRNFESEEEKMLSAEWKRLVSLVNAVMQAGIVDKAALLEQLEFDLIGACGWGPNLSLEKLNKAMVKANTNALYRQRKYNLLGEESEGFAKLITELETLHAGNISAVVENMQRLIGYFRLDPNRVFDIILEVFETDPDNEAFIPLLSHFRISNLKQLLGFKFQAYHPPPAAVPASQDTAADTISQPGADATTASPNTTADLPKPTPLSLYLLTAKLCVRGDKKLLALQDIMPHLYPPPRDLSAMARERERRIHQSMREIGVVHLRTRTPEEIMAEEQEKMAKQAALKARIDFEDITNQKYGLVAGFLAAGYWDEALELASSLNTDAAFDHPQVLSVLFAQLHAAVEPLYRSFRVPLGALTAQLKANNKDFASNDSANSMAETTSRFSPVHTLDEFFERLSDVLGVLGHRIHKDVVLLTKIVRIARAQATAPGDVTVARKRKLIRMVSHTLLPGATLLSTPNPPLMLELWETIKDFPFTVRFDLYEIQRSDLYERVPDLKMARVQTAHEAKQTLKRVANNKEVMRLISRRLGKLSHNSPIVTLSAILKNIQAYDNLIGSMVDAIKYLSPLSYDVLAYLLIVFLGKDESLKIKDDGQSHSNWLQALCKFAGFFYAKYPTVELRGLFEYLARQLSLKQTLDLLTLEELISRMAGLEIIENVSDATLAAMGGGEKLRTQIRAAMGTTNIIKKKPINALRSVLEENSLIMPLLVLIAQQQQTTLFDAKDKNLKLVGHKHDKCASVLEQFVEFLALQVPVQELADKHMLPVAELCERFHIEPVVAFHIVRPLIAAALHQVFFADSDSAFKGSCAESRWSLKDEALRRWRPDSTELRDMAQAQINARTKRKLLSPDLYLMFWSLQLYDISVPRAQYDEEIERLKERAAGLKSGAIDQGLTDKKRKAEVQRCEDSIDPLEQELHQQTENRTFVLKHFDAGKASWIPIHNSDGEPIPAPVNLFALTEFLHVCILPRALYSMTDALYSARFIRLLHDRNVPNCPTAFIYKKALQFVVANMVCVTEREAENLGIFLKNLLDHLAAWCKDRKTFQAQFESKSGAFRKFTDPSSPKISFDEFTKLVRKFHENIMNLSISSLASSSYMQIRTALLITAKIGDLFPTHKSSALALRKEAKKLIETDGRQDIVTMARRYEAFLDSRVRGDKLVLDVKDSPSDKKPPAKKGDSGESNSKKSENTLAQEATSTSSSENASKTSGKESSDKSQSEKSTAASNRNTNSKSSKNSNQGKPKDNGNNKQSAAGGTTKASVSKSAPGSQNRNKDGRDISETTKSAVVAGNNNSNAAPTASSSSSSSSNENLNKGASNDAQSQNKGAAKKRARDDSSPSRSRGNDGADSKRARVDQDRRSPSRPSRTDRSGRRGGRNASPSSSHYRGDDRRDWGRDHRDRYPRDRDNRDWEYRDPRDRDFRDNRDTRGRNRDHGRDASRSRGDRRDSPARPDSRNSGPSGPNSTAGNTNNNNNKPTNSNKDGPRNTGSGDNNNTNNNNNNNNNYNNGNNNKGRNDGGARRGRRRGGGGVGGGRR